MMTNVMNGKTFGKIIACSNVRGRYCTQRSNKSSKGGHWEQNASYVCWRLLSAFGEVTQERRELRKEQAGLQTKMKENEDSPEIQSLASLEKKPTISIPWKKTNYFYPPKAKDTIGKASEVEVPSKTFQPNTFPTSGNQNEASGNPFTQVRGLRKKQCKGRVLVIYH